MNQNSININKEKKDLTLQDKKEINVRQNITKDISIFGLSENNKVKRIRSIKDRK